MVRIVTFFLSAVGLMAIGMIAATLALSPATLSAPRLPVERPPGAYGLTTSIGWDIDLLAVLRAAAAGTPIARPLRILMISMGGDYAGYGAGLITASAEQEGWLDFDIITGVSAGGLLGAFAFARDIDRDAVTRRVTAVAQGQASLWPVMTASSIGAPMALTGLERLGWVGDPGVSAAAGPADPASVERDPIKLNPLGR